MNDAARSAKQNIQEGYFYTTRGFVRSLATSQGSVAELEGDVEDCFDDGLITKEEMDELTELCGKLDYLLDRLIASLRRKASESKDT